MKKLKDELYMCSVCLVVKSCLTFATPWTVACQAPLSMGFPRQEYWDRLLFTSPRDLSDPGIKPTSPALQVVSYCWATRETHIYVFAAAAADAKSLQSCPTLCNPIDGSPPGSPVPGILQARTLEWAAISFSRYMCLVNCNLKL